MFTNVFGSRHQESDCSSHTCKRPCLCHHNERNDQEGTWTIDCSLQRLNVIPAQPCSQEVDTDSVISL